MRRKQFLKNSQISLERMLLKTEYNSWKKCESMADVVDFFTKLK